MLQMWYYRDFAQNYPTMEKALVGKTENGEARENPDAHRKAVTAKAFALTNKEVETATDVITGTT